MEWTISTTRHEYKPLFIGFSGTLAGKGFAFGQILYSFLLFRVTAGKAFWGVDFFLVFFIYCRNSHRICNSFSFFSVRHFGHRLSLDLHQTWSKQRPHVKDVASTNYVIMTSPVTCITLKMQCSRLNIYTTTCAIKLKLCKYLSWEVLHPKIEVMSWWYRWYFL